MKYDFHIAKLSLFTVRTLSTLESKRTSWPELESFILQRAREDKIGLPISLMHQGVLISHAYICFVWLRGCIEANGMLHQISVIESEFAKRFEHTSVKLSSSGRNGRDLTKVSEFIRTIRNSLSHAMVGFDDDCFFFVDSKNETDQAEIQMSWKQLGEACDAMLFATQAIVYPDQKLREL